MEMLRVKDLVIIPAKGEEEKLPGRGPEQTVKALSRAKAAEIAAQRPDTDVVIGADTIVWLDGCILGKPKDAEDARAMLRALSGRTHEVYSGVTVMLGGRTLCESECTAVRFKPLGEAEIAAYVATGEPMDKAGAYAAQGLASLFVEGIEGDFFNVMGLPLFRLGRMLDELGVKLI